MKKEKSVRLIINFALSVLVLMYSFIISHAASDSISFTKKEIAFFKWGDGEKEIKLNKITHKTIDRSKGVTQTSEDFLWPSAIVVDGNDSIYLNGGNGQIFIISSDGSSIKTVSAKKTGGLVEVDGDGNIYGTYSKKGEPLGFIRTKPDGTQEVYKNFDLGYVENEIAYPISNKAMSGNQPITFSNIGDKAEKLPPHLLSRDGEVDLGKLMDGKSFVIHTRKINKHLKKINRRIDADKILIEVEEKDGMPPRPQFLGIDDNGNSYFLCGYHGGWNSLVPWKETYIMAYSQTGQKLAEIPIDPDYFDKHVGLAECRIDIHGNLFQSWASKDGVHIFKWTKIKNEANASEGLIA